MTSRRTDTRPQKEADKLKNNKNREVKGTCRCPMFPLRSADSVPSDARKSSSLLMFLAALHADLSSAKRRVASRLSKNNFNCAMLLRLLSESDPHGDPSFCSM